MEQMPGGWLNGVFFPRTFSSTSLRGRGLTKTAIIIFSSRPIRRYAHPGLEIPKMTPTALFLRLWGPKRHFRRMKKLVDIGLCIILSVCYFGTKPLGEPL